MSVSVGNFKRKTQHPHETHGDFVNHLAPLELVQIISSHRNTGKLFIKGRKEKHENLSVNGFMYRYKSIRMKRAQLT